MQDFFTIAIRLLRGYKAMLKKQLSREAYRERLQQLQLDQSLPRHSVALYQLLVRIIEFAPLAEQQLVAEPSRLRYSGGDQFFREIKALLSQYHIEGEMLVHTSQEASGAMVAAIQLIALPARTVETQTKLLQHAQKIARYGLTEQRQLLLNSLKTHLKKDKIFFSPILQDYQEYLSQHGECEKKNPKKHRFYSQCATSLAK